MEEMPTFAAMSLDMVLRWGASYNPIDFTIVPTFIADRKVWPL